MSVRLFVAILAIFAAATLVFGQGSAVKSTAQANQPAAGNPAPLPDGKVAIINSQAFPEGIGEYKKELDKLEAEFKSRSDELERLQNVLLKLDEELKTIKDEKLLQQKVVEGQSKKKEFDRKREDYQADLQKRSEVVLGPVRDKVMKFLDGYANSHGIVVVFDLPNAAQNGGLVYLNPAINITEDFIKEYNKQNPVPSAPPKPAPARR